VNDVYFACRTCKTYQDAGYRWGASTLERSGIVERGKPVEVSAVLNATEYWRGSQKAAWLDDLLPKVREFLDRHRSHELIYGTGEDIGLVPMDDDDAHFLDWMNETDDKFELLPRAFIEKLGYDNWDQVIEHVSRLEHKPWWWHHSELRQKAQEKFASLQAQ
jgi:hypothetical protein